MAIDASTGAGSTEGLTDDGGAQTEPAVDLAFGSFTSSGPWVIDPEAIAWRSGIDELRERAANRVPELVEPPMFPPFRGVVILASLSLPLTRWAVRNRAGRREDKAQAELAALVRHRFERLGATFIKLGQLIAGGEGVLPKHWTEEFKRCRDRVPPESFDHVRTVIEQDLGGPLEKFFSSFDTVPFAAASIAQVHAARLISGEEVVVKVQRPRIDKVVASDIAAMAWLVSMIERLNPQLRIINMSAYVELFAETIVEELDFRLEAQNMLDIAWVLASGDERVIIVPRPHPEMVTRRVLVMQRLDGHAVDDETALANAGVDPSSVLRALMQSFFEGALIHGVFHGDLHAGNMVIDDTGRPTLFDFGITGRFPEDKRQALLGLMFASTIKDELDFIRHWRDLGGFSADADLEQIAEEMKVHKLRAQPEGEVSSEEMARQMQQTVKRLISHGARLPKELFLFMKSFLYLSGAIARVAADVDMAAETAELFTRLTTTHSGAFEAIGADLSLVPDTETLAERNREDQRKQAQRQKQHKQGGHPGPKKP